jgi:hypothetical protein
VVKLLTRGAKVDIWNQKNVSGLDAAADAVGVHRGMNFRFHVPTADALRDIMVGTTSRPKVEPEQSSAGPRRRSRGVRFILVRFQFGSSEPDLASRNRTWNRTWNGT